MAASIERAVLFGTEGVMRVKRKRIKLSELLGGRQCLEEGVVRQPWTTTPTSCWKSVPDTHTNCGRLRQRANMFTTQLPCSDSFCSLTKNATYQSEGHRVLSCCPSTYFLSVL